MGVEKNPRERWRGNLYGLLLVVETETFLWLDPWLLSIEESGMERGFTMTWGGVGDGSECQNSLQMGIGVCRLHVHHQYLQELWPIITAYQLPANPGPDHIIWTPCADGVFTTRSAWEGLRPHAVRVPWANWDWRRILSCGETARPFIRYKVWDGASILMWLELVMLSSQCRLRK